MPDGDFFIRQMSLARQLEQDAIRKSYNELAHNLASAVVTSAMLLPPTCTALREAIKTAYVEPLLIRDINRHLVALKRPDLQI